MQYVAYILLSYHVVFYDCALPVANALFIEGSIDVDTILILFICLKFACLYYYNYYLK
jgi:hypothetical protein